MTSATLAGAFLIVVPVGFNVAFSLLAARLDYPDVPRRPTSEVLARFRAGGTRLVLTWWAFALTAVAMVPLTDADPNAGDARREAVDVILQAFNRYLGVAIGEHLGYAFTGVWTTLAGIALLETSLRPNWIGVPGIVVGPIVMLCSLEFVGRTEPTGWKVADKLTPIAYIAWSLWLIATGVVFVI